MSIKSEGSPKPIPAHGAVSQSLLNACIHCGLCLPACPTYLATGREMESPRGRIYLLNQWSNGEFELSGRLAEHIDSCLGCLGCQTACPSGVQYESILEAARVHLAQTKGRRYRRLLRFALSRILPDYKKLRSLARIARIWQISGANGMLRLPWLKRLWGPFSKWQIFLPSIPQFKSLPSQSWQSGAKKGTAQLFSGCVMDVLYNQVNHASIRLLLNQRWIVQVPEQTCCGALAAHAGEIDIAQQLAKSNIAYFEKTNGPIVVTAAGCGAMLKNYGHLLADDPLWSERASKLSDRVVDITECLASGEFTGKPTSHPKKVAYHAACHLLHAQNVDSAPLKLLSEIPGLTLVPLTEYDHCCGSAGIFNLTHTDLSLKILERKMQNIRAADADSVVTTNPGCLLQLQAGMKAAELKVEIRHLVEILDQVYS